jgi:pSer/pThr/pTyr-binding forkhead associated (FHA) protein
VVEAVGGAGNPQYAAAPVVPVVGATPPGVGAIPAPAPPAPEPEADCEVFRPTHRPPGALLVILDDGSRKNGEYVRLRADRTVLGRGNGEILIPHDNLMSTQHAEIIREMDRGRYRWFLRDMGSTNGTFVRGYKFPLKHDQEIVIGTSRYRYQQAQHAEPADDAGPPTQQKSTMGWQAVTAADVAQMFPSLVEQLPSGEDGQVLSLKDSQMTLGSDPSKCSLVVENDPFVSGLHATISQTNDGRWVIKDAGSINGVWLRIRSIPIDTNCEFQLGEQRFQFRLS